MFSSLNFSTCCVWLDRKLLNETFGSDILCLSVVLIHLGPTCSQEYKWRELEEQRQAQKLQRQLQQEQAYLLSLQQTQNQDNSKTAQQQSTKQPLSIEPDRENPGKTPNLDASKQSCNSEKAQPSPVSSLDKASEPERRVTDLQSPAPDFEPVREVTASPDRCRMLPLLV